MKRILKLLTGIAILIAILVAASCSRPEATVNIYCKAVEVGGELEFTIYDADSTVVATPSKDPAKFVADLITDVEPGTVVFWEWDEDSEVQIFVNVAPPAPGKIFPGPANPSHDSKKFKLVIPGNAPEGTEAYYIEFVWQGDTVTIDPHLRVPPGSGGS
jgi:hypothetical protein